MYTLHTVLESTLFATITTIIPTLAARYVEGSRLKTAQHYEHQASPKNLTCAHIFRFTSSEMASTDRYAATSSDAEDPSTGGDASGGTSGADDDDDDDDDDDGAPAPAELPPALAPLPSMDSSLFASSCCTQ